MKWRRAAKGSVGIGSHFLPAVQRTGAQLRGPAAAEHRPRQTLRRQTPPRPDAPTLGRVSCTLLDGMTISLRG